MRRDCVELCERKINKIQFLTRGETQPFRISKKNCTFKMDDFLLTILPSILVPCDLDFYLHIDILSFLYVCLPTIFAVEDFWTNFSRQHCRPHLSGPGRKDIASSLKLSTVKYHCFSILRLWIRTEGSPHDISNSFSLGGLPNKKVYLFYPSS